jgi:hypothetical protein
LKTIIVFKIANGNTMEPTLAVTNYGRDPGLSAKDGQSDLDKCFVIPFDHRASVTLTSIVETL